jgi:TRAP transporter TAXI family solute receptor
MGRLGAVLRARVRPRAVGLAAVLALVAMAGAWSALRPGENVSPRATIVITTGQQRGVYYSWATALARETHAMYPGLNVTVLGSSGSVDNLERVASGVADFGLTTEDATEDRSATTGFSPTPLPASGTGATSRPVDRSTLVALARVYDDYVHVVVRADGPVQKLADLAGRPVATGQPRSGVALVASRVLEEARIGVRAQAVDLATAMDMLRTRQVDAVFWSGGLPTGAVTDLARRVRLRLLPLDSVSAQMRARFGVAYRPAQIPAGSYGLTAPVATLASPNLLVARKDADPRVVKALLDTMFRRRDAIAAAVPAANALDRRTAISSGSLPLHPAAAAYYRSTKP